MASSPGEVIDLVDSDDDVGVIAPKKVKIDARTPSRVMPKPETESKPTLPPQARQPLTQLAPFGRAQPAPPLAPPPPAAPAAARPGQNEAQTIGHFIAQAVGRSTFRTPVRTSETLTFKMHMTEQHRIVLDVYNLTGQQVGWADQNTTVCLVPLLRANLVQIHATALLHLPDAASIPFAVYVRGSDVSTILHHLAPVRLQLSQHAQRQPGGPPGQTLNTLIGRTQTANFAPQSTFEAVADPVTEDSMVMSQKDLEALPMVPENFPAGLKTSLLSHQRQGLMWMLQRENTFITKEKDTLQFWKHCPHFDTTAYVHQLTKETVSEQPYLSRGGILADDMGLGKTLQIIALIVSDPAGGGLLKQSRDVNPRYAKTTLIVCPLSVMTNWTSQIERHCALPLKVAVYHGEGRALTAAQMVEHDIIITTYATLANEFKAIESSEALQLMDTLFHVHWRRVVLDEGHVIKNHTTRQSLAAVSVSAERSWLLSGTPIQNRIDDLYAVLKFIRYTPFHEKDLWLSYFQHPIKVKRPDGLQRLRTLMREISLRRTKSMTLFGKPILELPKKTIYVHKIRMDPKERDIYSRLAGTAKDYFQEGMEAKVKPTDFYKCIFEMITRLRQACDDLALIKVLDKYLGENADGNIDAMVRAMIVEQDTDECPICDNVFTDAQTAGCNHLYCRECLEHHLGQPCTLCNVVLTLADPTKVTSEPSIMPPADEDDMRLSSKTRALLSLLADASSKNPSTKTVIFSQWTSMLDRLAIQLAKSRFKYVRLDGRMKREERDISLHTFASDPETNVILLSLTCGSLGLDLCCASQAFLIDPWWNGAVEDQAIDRIYRLGQKKDVTIYRLVMEDSIEEKVLDLQQKKRELVQEAFGKDLSDTSQIRMQKHKKTRASYDDIRLLLGLGPSRRSEDRPIQTPRAIGEAARRRATTTTTASRQTARVEEEEEEEDHTSRRRPGRRAIGQPPRRARERADIVIDDVDSSDIDSDGLELIDVDNTDTPQKRHFKKSTQEPAGTLAREDTVIIDDDEPMVMNHVEKKEMQEATPKKEAEPSQNLLDGYDSFDEYLQGSQPVTTEELTRLASQSEIAAASP